MHLGQIKPNGAAIAAVIEDHLARPIPGYTMLDLIRRAELDRAPLGELAASLASRHAEEHTPILPIHPPEVWGCACTCEGGASRPGIFFKGTTRVCVAGGQPIGIRPDSQFTVPQPELAVVLASRGRVAGYTLANDVSACDIEGENPRYLTQARFYDGSCALGPVILPAEELRDPYSLRLTCTIERNGRELFSAAVSTAALDRIETLIQFLTRANHVPAGAVMLTGPGMVVPREAALAPGDRVTIRIAEIGELVNYAAMVG